MKHAPLFDALQVQAYMLHNELQEIPDYPGWMVPRTQPTCMRCGKDYHDPVALYPFEERKQGMITRGWRCNPLPFWKRRRGG